jgi:uncharacterized membrane protein (UPF0127 family)
MAQNSHSGYAFNRTRQTFLATEMKVAGTHWTRFKGLMATSAAAFGFGQGLWIVPCHGVHTWAMRFPIDIVYLDHNYVVVHLEENLKPWSFAPVRMDAATVLELPGHTIWDSGTKIGDQIELTFKTGTQKGAAA